MSKRCKCNTSGSCCITSATIERLCPTALRPAYHWYRHNRLVVLTLVGVIVGVGLGIGLRTYKLDDGWIHFIGFPGTIFLRVLKMMVVPVIIASIISGSATLNLRATGRMAVKTMLFFLGTTVICALIGISLASAIHPGDPVMLTELEAAPVDVGDQPESGMRGNTLDAFMDIFRNAFPDNIVLACFRQRYTVYVPHKPSFRKANVTDEVPTANQILNREQRDRDELNALGLIVFCIGFGTMLGTLHSEDGASSVIEFFNLLDTAVTMMVQKFLWFSPLGVASLICYRLLITENLVLLFAQLGWFSFTVILGLAIHQLLLLPLIYFAFVRKNPYVFAWNMAQAWLTAFALSSSSATLPVTMRCMEEKNHADPRVIRFVLPVGATINMDGTAIFTTVTPLFLAQIRGFVLSAGNYVTLIFLSTAVSVSAAALPSSSLFLMVILTGVLEIPATDIGILFAVDWLLDRFRTTSNMMGDCYAAAVVEKISSYELAMDSLLKIERTAASISGPSGKFDATADAGFAQKAATYASVSGDRRCPLAHPE